MQDIITLLDIYQVYGAVFYPKLRFFFVAEALKEVPFTPDTVFPIFGKTNVMIEAFDRADQKAMLLQSFISERPGVPFIGASGMAGFGPGETLGIKKMGRYVYVVGDLETGARPGCGLMAPRVGIAASMQANLALRLIVEDQ